MSKASDEKMNGSDAMSAGVVMVAVLVMRASIPSMSTQDPALACVISILYLGHAAARCIGTTDKYAWIHNEIACGDAKHDRQGGECSDTKRRSG